MNSNYKTLKLGDTMTIGKKSWTKSKDFRGKTWYLGVSKDTPTFDEQTMELLMGQQMALEEEEDDQFAYGN